MAYQELIKNFEKIRTYMREFYVYGFKSRTEYKGKSPRSYDDERRRLESWLGEYMRFSQTPEGKNVFLSIDSRTIRQNPFYKAFKAKSFTDGDITLHFALFDVLHDPAISMTLSELTESIDALLAGAMVFDQSTLRKKLKEYTDQGLILTEKQGRRVYYRRSPDTDLSQLTDVLDFFSEAAPAGVIGSFLQDRLPPHQSHFAFKHHYITGAIDSQVLVTLFQAIEEKRYITAENLSHRVGKVTPLRLVPIKIYISAQNGRQNLIALHVNSNRLNSYRLDYLTKVKLEEPYEKFDELRVTLNQLESHMWGVNARWSLRSLEQVEFTVYIGKGEEYILRRLEREKRCGRIEQVDDTHYRFTAEVFDTREMLPWIRTFLSRITRLHFSNSHVEKSFKRDLSAMYRLYGLEEKPEAAEGKEETPHGLQ